MSYIFKKGATSQSIELYIIDSTDGTPETGVLWNTAGIDLKYRRKDAAVVAITEAALTSPALTDTWETGGFLEIGNGVYRLDLPDAALASASGIDRVVVFGTVTGMVVLPVTIHLTDIDLNTALASSTIGTCTTNTDMVGTDGAALASVVGALADAAAAGEVTEADTLMQYIKQLLNVLIGAAGIGAFPAEAAPANAVSLAEVIRAIHVDVTGLNGSAMVGTNSAALASVLGAAVGASISADIAAVKAETVLIVEDTDVIDDGTSGLVKIAQDAAAVLVDTTGLNGDAMRGTNGANTTVPDAAGVAPTAAEIKTAMEAEGTSDLDLIADAIAHGTYGLSAIRTRGDAAWAGAPESVSGTLVVNTADTIFDLTATLGTLSPNDDAYNNMIICILDNSGSVYETARITDYVGASTRITIDHELTFPVDDGVDTFVIYRAAFNDAGEATISDADKNDIVDKVRQEPIGSETSNTMGWYQKLIGDLTF